MVFSFYRRPLRIFFFFCFVYFLILTKSHSRTSVPTLKNLLFFLFRKFRSLCHTRSFLSLCLFRSIRSLILPHPVHFSLSLCLPPLSVPRMTRFDTNSLVLRRRTKSLNGGSWLERSRSRRESFVKEIPSWIGLTACDRPARIRTIP